MTELTATEMFNRIADSLRKNSAELANELAAERHARIRQIVVMLVIFITGIAAGFILANAL